MVDYGHMSSLQESRALYHKLIQPTYERSVIKHVYDNNISLKTGASAQLLNKRPKTTGYLGKRNLGETPSTLWCAKSQITQSVGSRTLSRVGPSRLTQESRSTWYHNLTDEKNIRASTQSNTFSATTRVREVPVPGIYKVEIQQFRTRSPSGRGVRATPLTNRSLIGTQSTRSTALGSQMASHKGVDNTCQVVRLQKEFERHQHSREMKRQAQISEHRLDRMYYMNGVTAKLHAKYDINDEDLERLESIAVSRGIKLPVQGTLSYSRPSSTFVPTSTPRSAVTNEASSAKTIIPTADVASTQGDVTSQEGDDLSDHQSYVPSSGKEDAATSDHEDACMIDVNETEDNKTHVVNPEINHTHINSEGHMQQLEISSTFFTDLTTE